MNSSELTVAVAGAALIVGFVLWRWLGSWLRRPVTPAPWGPEIAEAMERPEAMPPCPHCQCPHEAQRWFCPECGRGVGDYNTFNPYLNLFSVGEVLREGTSSRVRKTWLTVTGFLVLSLI